MPDFQDFADECEVFLATAKVTRQSDTILSGTLVDVLRMCGGLGDVISAEGSLWKYVSLDGIWWPITEEQIESLVMLFDGAPCKDGVLSISSGKTSAVANCARKRKDILNPRYFDRAPPGVVCSNGFATVGEHGVELKLNGPGNLARHRLDIKYDPKADRTRWLGLLYGLFPEEKDADARIACLQEFVGACLIGQAAQYGRCMVLTGGGSNGKSTFIEVVSALFPEECVTAVAPQRWSRDYNLARLRGSMLNAVNELPESDIMASDAFKGVVTGERIEAREPYGRPFSFSPKAGHLFACNSLPGSVDHSFGFWRRFLVCEFTADFSRDPGARTKEAIVTEMMAELPAVLAWALEGAARLVDRGRYTIPPSSEEALAGWKRASNSVASWIDMDGIRKCGPGEDWPRAAEVYRAYSDWAKDGGHKPVSLTSFGKRLKQMGFDKRREAVGYRYNLKSM